MRGRVSSLFALVTLGVCLQGPATAQSIAQARRDCFGSKGPVDKVVICGFAIDGTRDAQTLARLFLRRGNAFVELGRHREAVSDFTQLIRFSPNVAGYFDNRQTSYRELGMFREALADANRAVSLKPELAFVYRSRALTYEAMKQISASLADFNRALSIDPSNLGLIVDRARVVTKDGRPREAIQSLTRVIEIDPANTAAYRERGIAYAIDGNIAAARPDLVIAARAYPNDGLVREALAAIESNPQASQRPTSPPSQAAQPSKPAPSKSDEKGPSTGTGFFVTADGFLVTNAHVVQSCPNVQVTSGNTLKADGRVVAKDGANDLALVKIEKATNTFAKIRTGVRTGESISAFGYPLFGLLTSTGNFTVGNVSAVAGLGDDTRFIQISAPVQPGNSGGPVLDESGNLVGVVVSKLDSMKVASAINDMPQNVNFAIKAAVLANFLESREIKFEAGAIGTALNSADIAERAKSMAVLIQCGGS